MTRKFRPFFPQFYVRVKSAKLSLLGALVSKQSDVFDIQSKLEDQAPTMGLRVVIAQNLLYSSVHRHCDSSPKRARKFVQSSITCRGLVNFAEILYTSASWVSGRRGFVKIVPSLFWC